MGMWVKSSRQDGKVSVFFTKKLQDFCNKGKNCVFLHSKLCHFSKQNKSCPNIKPEDKCILDYNLKVTVPRSHNQNQNGHNKEHGYRVKDKYKNKDRKINIENIQFQLSSQRMKGKRQKSDMIKGPWQPFLNQLVNVSVTIQRPVPASTQTVFSDSLFGPFIYPWGP